MIKLPSLLSDYEYIEFFRQKNIFELVNNKSHSTSGINLSLNTNYNKKNIPTYGAELDDLYVIYNLVTKYKRTTVLEFGTGWSTLVISAALEENRRKYLSEAKSLRRHNLFQCHSLDNEKKYLEISKNRLSNELKKNTFFHYSEVKMTTFNNRICNEYETLPLINPDFIYIDGPDQTSSLGEINGITTSHKDMMPMNCDVLKIEHFLIPGTIILLDGRTANARFLKNNLQRNWNYQHHSKSDHHVFYLNEEPLGRINQDIIDFYNEV